MSIKECALSFKDKVSRLKPDDLIELAADIERIIEKSNKTGKDTALVIREFADEYSRRIEMNRAQKLKTVEKFNFVKEFINQEAFKRDQTAGLRALFSPDDGKNYKGTASITGRTTAITSTGNRMLMNTINEFPSIRKRLDADDRDLDRNVMKLLLGEDAKKFAPEEVALAKTIKKINNYMFSLKRQAGFGTRELESYIAPSMHDAQVMREMGKGKWMALAEKVFDFEKSGILPDEISLRLENFYDNRLKNIGKIYSNTDETFENLLTNSASERMGTHRIYHFKNGEMAFLYNKEMGGKSLINRVRDGVEKDSRTIAAAQVLGPNYHASFQRLLNIANDNHVKEFGKGFGNKGVKKLNEEFKLATQGDMHSEMNIIAKWGDISRKMTNMSRLDKALATTITDIPLSGGIINGKTGDNIFSIHKKVVLDFAKRFGILGKKEGDKRMREFAAKTGLFMDDFIQAQAVELRFADVASGGFTGIGSIPKNVDSIANQKFPKSFADVKKLEPKLLLEMATNKLGDKVIDPLHDWTMRWTGLPRQSKAFRQTVSKYFMSYLDDHKHLKFDELDLGMQQGFNKYGITSEKWDVLKHASDEFEDGSRALTPEMIHELDDSFFKNLEEVKKVEEDFLKRAKKNKKGEISKASKKGLNERKALKIDELRNDIMGSYTAYLKETPELGSPTPGFRDEFFKSQISGDRNSITGQALRFALQYKSFILAQEKTLKALFTTGKNPYKNFATTAISSMAAGYVALSLKDISLGKAPRDPFSSETALASALQSGLGLMYADILLADHENAYVKLANMIVGPVPTGLGQDFLTVLSKVRKEPGKLYDIHFKGEAVKQRLTFAEILKKIERNSPVPFAFSRALINKNIFRGINHILNVDQKKPHKDKKKRVVDLKTQDFLDASVLFK